MVHEESKTHRSTEVAIKDLLRESDDEGICLKFDFQVHHQSGAVKTASLEKNLNLLARPRDGSEKWCQKKIAALLPCKSRLCGLDQLVLKNCRRP